jgi:hypothetical protein
MGVIPTVHPPRPVRLVFTNQEQREDHIQAFFAWLPNILHDAPNIYWERLPSVVMGYLILRLTHF